MATATLPNETQLQALPCAVAWIGGEWASVARMDRDGEISTSSVHRGAEPEVSYLELVVRVIGDAHRVVIMGPSALRLELERAYVAMYQRPDRLVDVEPSDIVPEAELIARLRELAG